MRTSILLVSILLICGCNQGKKPVTEFHFNSPVDSAVTAFIPIPAPEGMNPWAGDLTEHERANLEQSFGDVSQLTVEIERYITMSDSSDEVVDAHVRAELALWQDNPFYYFLAQSTASDMVLKRLLVDSVTPVALQPIVAYYVDLAHKNKHPDSEFYIRALPFLNQNKYWNDEKVILYAGEAQRRAGMYVGLRDHDNEMNRVLASVGSEQVKSMRDNK